MYTSKALIFLFTVGDEVTLMFPQLTFVYEIFLYLIKLVSENWHEFLRGTFAFDYNSVEKSPHITTKQESGTFTLHVNNKKSDA